MAKLTDTEIKRARVKGKPYSMGDGGGLYLWVKPTGGKLWRWSYRFESKEKLMSFGKYPDVSLAMSRDRHADARKLLATGVDPMAQRKIEKKVQKVSGENSFQRVSAHWLEYWQEGKSRRHVDSVRRRMAADILPCLRARPIAKIEAPELVAMANTIQDRGARDIAKRALETVGQVFRYAIAHGFAKRSPAAKVLVRESYENYSAEFEGNEEDLYTDTKGCVFFLPKRVRSSLLKRFGAIISSAMSGAHASFGPHSNVTAFQGKQRGDDIRRGLLFTWEGSPARMSSVLKLQNQ